MSANLENPTVAAGLEKSVFIPVLKKDSEKIVHTTRQLCSFPRQIRMCSKSSKLRFSSTWIKNFQMYKLGLEKAEEPEIKLPILIGS